MPGGTIGKWTSTVIELREVIDRVNRQIAALGNDGNRCDLAAAGTVRDALNYALAHAERFEHPGD